MIRRLTSTVGRLRADTRGLAMIEFAMLLPTLLVILFGGTQLIKYIDATRKVELVSSSIAQMISQATAPPGSSTASINKDDLHFAFDATMLLFPYILKASSLQNKDWTQIININVSSISFTQTSPLCGAAVDPSTCYVAKVIWTSSGAPGAQFRPCVLPQLPADNSAPPTRNTLPHSVFGPGTLIAVDVVFDFVPTFGAKFIKPLRIARSIFVQPRYASLITYDTTNNDGIASLCP
jgi:Flp pilus assembly protein TadG